MKNVLCGLLFVLVTAALGGEAEGAKPAKSRLLDDNGKFWFYISNQSGELKSVKVKVEIDGEAVVDEAFDVGDGERSHHNWKQFRLTLAPGKHKLKVSSANGDATLEKEFEVTGEHWAVLDYWFDPQQKDQKEKHFTFSVKNEAVHFK